MWLLSKKVNVPITKKCVLGSKTVDCVFLVYDIHNVGYKTFIEKYEVPIILGTIIESRDVTFFENIFSIRDETSPSKQEFIEDDISITTTERTAPIVEIKHMIRATMKFFSDGFIVYLIDDTLRTIEESHSSPDASYCKEVVRSEMDSIMSNGTWKVVDHCWNDGHPPSRLDFFNIN